MVAISSTVPLAPVSRASLGYSGSFLRSSCAGTIWPPDVAEPLLSAVATFDAAAGAALLGLEGVVGAIGEVTEFRLSAETLGLEPSILPIVGASGRSVAVTG